MEPQEIYNHAKEKLGDEKVVEFVEGIGDPFIVVSKDHLLEVAKFFRDDEELQYKHLSLVTGLDFEDRYESVYHLVSYEKQNGVTLKVRLPKEDGEPECVSLVPVWKAADWHERETFDLVGITYTDHPNLRRILLPADWEGHPLRKDYVMPSEFNGISNLP
jgi:NADH-quinone oxidoreductase subunit C